MLDITLSFLDIERTNMAGRGDPLAQLLHVRMLQDLAKLRLPDQKGLQQRLFAELKIRQHAQFFDRARREVLRFVHDQQAAFAFADLRHQEGLQRHQQIGLRHILDPHTKGGADHAQGVFRIELRADQVGRSHRVSVHTLEQPTHDGGFARTYFAGDDDEPLIAQQAVL